MPVGTGPYRVVIFRPEEVISVGAAIIQTNKIIYEPNPYFREPGKPFFGRVELKGGGDANESARAVLQTGDVDFAANLQIEPERLAQLEAAGQGQVVANFGARVGQIVLNLTDPNLATRGGERSSLAFPHPFFSDKKVRQAFAYAIDRAAIAGLYGETGRLTSNILVAPELYTSPNTFYEFDLNKATALLDEAGWTDTDGDGIRDKDGLKMKVVFQASLSSLVQQTQAIVKKGLEAIGVEVEVAALDPSVYFGDPVFNPSTMPCSIRPLPK
jgi:peptide/nickel transport system substrate-binding protein